MTTWHATFESPLGPMRAVKTGAGLLSLVFVGQKYATPPDPAWVEDLEAFVRERAQLDEYFEGRRVAFELALAPEGTAFQRRVWDGLRAIPLGETRGYGELAVALGLPAGAARAVGAANGRNPIAVVVPCHRVIGASGALTGYAGGVARKRWLLEHERAVAGAARGAG